LLSNADVAMYRAKESGRNTVKLFRQEMNSANIERLQMTGDLRRAIESNAFRLDYQPIMDVSSGMIVGAEALLRWQQKGRTVAPSEFIPLAEDTGLIVPIGRWVLQTACMQAKAFENALRFPLRIAVNISPRQFRQTDLVDSIESALRESGLASHLLELEITEGILMDERGSAAETLQHLRSMGISVAIDDFGTGYSSLSYLKKFPVDRLKIDQAFTRHTSSDGNNAILTTTIIAMAKNLGMRVLAEGIETQDDLDFMRSRTCDEAQGFYIARPMDPVSLIAFCEEHVPLERC
jgi:EAL domain-containing protein (putative c-di-GMP-specific phosphodiesterase class I)